MQLLDKNESQIGQMNTLSAQLTNEFFTWFLNLVAQDNDLPKVFSGVKADGAQFIVVLSDLPIELCDHLDFMRSVLKFEDAKAFIYKTRFGAFDEKTNTIEERVAFFAGENNLYVSIEIAPVDGVSWKSGYRETQRSETLKPETFMSDLLQSPYLPSEKDGKFLSLWQSVRDKVMWRQCKLNLAE